MFKYGTYDIINIETKIKGTIKVKYYIWGGIYFKSNYMVS